MTVSRSSKPCLEVVTPECQYPRSKRSTKWCVWHWLKRQPASIQTDYAQWRLAKAEKAEGYQYRPRVPEAEWPQGERWCSGCQTMVPNFYTTGSRCKACASKAAHENRVTDQYGLRPGEYDEMFVAQGRRCAICRGRPIMVRLAVDHDHRTGTRRGLLESKCNHELLGAAHESPSILARALAYLLSPPADGWEAYEAKYREIMEFVGLETYLPAEEETPDPFDAPRQWRGPSRAKAGTPF